MLIVRYRLLADIPVACGRIRENGHPLHEGAVLPFSISMIVHHVYAVLTEEMILIELQHLTKTYKTRAGELHAIEDINLTINDGEIFGIIGLSGAGKSTLIRCINFLERPTEGKVLLDGVDLGSLTHRQLLQTRRSMSMIFQGFNLLSQRTALRNVCYPMEIARIPRDAAITRAKELLALVGLSDKENAYPSQLSGGQKQRIAIARALATNPKVLLCDEATSALDPNTTQSILDLLKSINKTMGVTIIVITHEMKVIDSICDKVAVLDHSHIVEVGEVREVFTNPQSDIARELILPGFRAMPSNIAGTKLRLVFDGEDASLPIISELVMTCGIPVNILFADTRESGGGVYGQMLIQLPDDNRQIERVCAYLDGKSIVYHKEV